MCRLVLLGANPRHLESQVGGIVVRVSSERGGGGWLAKPPTRVSGEGGWCCWVRIPSVTRVLSEGGSGGGQESPPSLKSRVGGW